MVLVTSRSVRRHGILACSALFAPLMLLSDAARSEAAAEIEEIVVTGSYLRKDRFDMASPIDVISSEDLRVSGNVNLGQFVRDLSYTQNTDTVANVLGVTSGLQDSNSAQFNLRGLGTASTLTLFDGRRTVSSGNISGYVPDIATDRIEILLDGGSALYGTDAVAGVVNIIPIKSYDGVKVRGLYRQDDGGDFDEPKVAILAGQSFEDAGLDIVAAFEYSERSALRRFERPKYLRADDDASTSGMPGRYSTAIPGFFLPPALQALAGSFEDQHLQALFIPTTRVRDPGCGTFNEGHEDDGEQGSFPSGRPTPDGVTCQLEFGQFQDYARPNEDYNLYLNATYRLTDRISLEGQMNFNYRISTLIASPTTVQPTNNTLLRIPTSNPGVPAGVTFPLIPGGAFGIGWRPFAQTGTLPSHLDDVGSTSSDFNYYTDRYKVGATYEIGNGGWSGETWLSWQESRTRLKDVYDLSFSRLQDALNGVGGPNGDEFFNPFASADPRSADYVEGVTNNSQELVDHLFLQADRTTSRTKFWYVESFVTGNLFELPAGPLAAAFGFQIRETEEIDYPNPTEVRQDDYNTPITDDPPVLQSLESRANAVFVELDVPILENLTFNTAVRHEDFTDLDLDATKPKFSLRYEPLPTLALRASYGESFLAPDPDEVIPGLRDCVQVFAGSDPFFDNPLGLQGARSCATGNSELQPEESEIINFGITWRPIERLEISLDAQNVDYTDRIVALISQQLVDRDFNNFLGANSFAAADDFYALSPAEQQALRADWFASNMDPLIERGSGPTFQVTDITRLSANLSNVEVTVFDLNMRYGWDTASMGSFAATFSGSYYDKYEYLSTDTGMIEDGAGKRNSQTAIPPPIPEFKLNSRLSWFMNKHSATVSLQFQDSIEFDGDVAAGATPPDRVGSYTTVDARYSYRFDNLWNGSLLMAVGADNLFDEEPDALPIDAGLETRIHDPFGRLLYLELEYELDQ